MTTPTWAELHAMEPGLRPEGTSEYGGCPLCGYDGLWNKGAMQEEIGLRNPVAEAAARDLATEWLANHSLYLVPVIADEVVVDALTIECQWAYQLHGSTGAFEHLWSPSGTHLGKDRDEALRAACAAVITSRGSSPASPPSTPSDP